MEGDFVAGVWGDGGGGEGVHLGDLNWRSAFEFDEVLGGFSQVGGVEEFGGEGVGGAWLFDGDGFGADGDEGVSGVVGVEVCVEGAGFDGEGGV